MGLIKVVVNNAVAQIDSLSPPESVKGIYEERTSTQAPSDDQKDSSILEKESNQEINPISSAEVPCLGGNKSVTTYDIFLQLPKPDLRNLCTILAHEG